MKIPFYYTFDILIMFIVFLFHRSHLSVNYCVALKRETRHTHTYSKIFSTCIRVEMWESVEYIYYKKIHTVIILCTL